MKHQVLLIEDDEVDVMMVKRAVEKCGRVPNFVCAVDGLEALEILRSKHRAERPKMILLDINMPRMNGLEFLKTLREDSELSHIPVIVLTSSRRDQDVCAAFAKQVAGYFIKPLEVDELSTMMCMMDKYWSASVFGVNCGVEDGVDYQTV